MAQTDVTMDVTLYIDRLYENESLVDNLTSDDAQVLLTWAERWIDHAKTEADIDELMAILRRINQMVGGGLPFSRLLPLLLQPPEQPQPLSPEQPQSPDQSPPA